MSVCVLCIDMSCVGERAVVHTEVADEPHIACMRVVHKLAKLVCEQRRLIYDRQDGFLEGTHQKKKKKKRVKKRRRKDTKQKEQILMEACQKQNASSFTTSMSQYH
jgi:hypothetical protein